MKSVQRLEHLFEIVKLFASFEDAEQPLDRALGLVAETLALQSAILIVAEGEHSREIVWHPADCDPARLRAAREHVEQAYRYLIGAAPTDRLYLREQQGLTPLPPPAASAGATAKRFIDLPLVVARGAPFGVLQIEGAGPLDEADLRFTNAIANQLAVALDRDRAWRRDIQRRERAEERRDAAETRSTTAEARRVLADSSKNEFQALAEENAALYAKAQRAVQVREQILAIVSHDLRNPLNTILLTADALVRDVAAEERRRELAGAVDRIHRAAGRMLRLIEDLLDFSSIEGGRLSIERQLHDPVEMIRETVVSFEGEARNKRLRLTVELPTDVPNAFCDRVRILQVLSNLVSNAGKVTPEEGQITLRLELRGQELLFAVSDTGPGIAQADIEHLFERYWRSGEARYKGTGLGLGIARGIIRAHGGRIWVESKPGHGATFLFTLPTVEAPQPSPQPRGTARS